VAQVKENLTVSNFNRCPPYLCGHDPLSLGDQSTFGADTVPPPAVTLVPLEGRHHPVVPTARTLGSALIPLRRPQEKSGRNGSQYGMLRHQGRNVHTARQTHAAGKSSSHHTCWFVGVNVAESVVGFIAKFLRSIQKFTSVYNCVVLSRRRTVFLKITEICLIFRRPGVDLTSFWITKKLLLTPELYH